MTFEEWWDGYTLMNRHELTTADLKNCYEAGWNSCAYTRSDTTYGEYVEEKQNGLALSTNTAHGT